MKRTQPDKVGAAPFKRNIVAHHFFNAGGIQYLLFDFFRYHLCKECANVVFFSYFCRRFRRKFRDKGSKGRSRANEAKNKTGGSSSVGRALASQAGGRGFETRLPLKRGVSDAPFHVNFIISWKHSKPLLIV